MDSNKGWTLQVDDGSSAVVTPLLAVIIATEVVHVLVVETNFSETVSTMGLEATDPVLEVVELLHFNGFFE